jgi:hypothetical protein
MGLWPALRRSKRRTSGQRTSTDPLPTLRALSELGWQLRCPSHGTCVFWHYHHLLGAPWSILGHMTAKTRGF